MNEPVKLQFELTPADVIHGLRVYDSRNALRLSKRMRTAALGIVAGAFLFYGTSQWIWLIVVPVGMLAINQLSFQIARPRQVRAMFTNPNFAGPYQITFDEDGMHGKTSAIDSRCSWATYTDFIEGSQEFLLLRGPMDYTLVPKRHFADDTAIDSFRCLLAQKMSKKDG